MSTTPTVNPADVLRHIEEHPETWEQGDYGIDGLDRAGQFACRTAYCYAGHASVTFAGDMPVWDIQPAGRGRTYRVMEDVIVKETGQRQAVHDRARELLGISEKSADILFHAANALDDLRRYTAILARGEELTEADVLFDE